MIHLTDKYRLTVDGSNWTLEEYLPEREVLVGKYKGKTAPASWIPVGFHGTLDQALRSALNKISRDLVQAGEVETLRDLLEVYTSFAEHLIQVANITAAQFQSRQVE